MSGQRRRRLGRREGFSLIELLVVMVVIAMLIGILMPVLGRAEEEARRTECRSNLRQIGQALILFSNDSGGYTPPTKGWLDYSPKRLGDCSDERYAPFVVNGWYGDADSDGGGPDQDLDGPAGNHPDTSLQNRPLSSGLGIIFKAGYLTSAGASLLHCPSDKSAPRKLPALLRSKYKYDANEPFWTSRTPEFSNENGIGDLGSTFDATVTDGDEKLRGRYVFTNYWIRTESKLESWTSFVDESPRYNSLRIRDAGLDGRRFVVRDPRDPQFGAVHGDTPGAGSSAIPDMPAYVSDSLGGRFPSEDELFTAGAVEYFGSDLITPPGDVFLQNHDASYNVLFVDGTVKTFADGGRNIKKALEAMTKEVPTSSEYQPGSAVALKIFRVYFDPLYVMD